MIITQIFNHKKDKCCSCTAKTFKTCVCSSNFLLSNQRKGFLADNFLKSRKKITVLIRLSCFYAQNGQLSALSIIKPRRKMIHRHKCLIYFLLLSHHINCASSNLIMGTVKIDQIMRKYLKDV